ncbi:MAG: hypothetical protein RIM99_01335 [Cyclobacteriaceae bacterium]
MIYTAFLALQLLIHPFHVSVTEIKYKEDKKAIQISTRIFLDDLEEALKVYTANDTLDITAKENWDIVNEALSKYIPENLKLYTEKEQLKAVYIGAEIEDDVMWTYVEIEKVKKLKTIKVWNSLLTEKFSDQENIIHFRAFGEVQSARLYKNEEAETFVWEQ